MGTKLPFEEHVRRKSPVLQKALLAIRDAVPHISSDYDREEIGRWVDSMARAQEKSAAGGYVGETLRKIDDRMYHDASKPAVKAAIDAIRAALKKEYV